MILVHAVGQSVVCRGSSQSMPDCDHEEADYRICVHVNDALHKGAREVLVRTVDTDVIVILVGAFFRLNTMYPAANIWMGFGTGKHFQYYNINSICHQLGESKSTALPFYHAFTGCDTTSQFFGKGKKIILGFLEVLPRCNQGISVHNISSIPASSAWISCL